MKKVFGLLCISALFTSLVSCADVDSRNNPTDPIADNFEADVLDDSSSSVASGDSDIPDENAESSSSDDSGNGSNKDEQVSSSSVISNDGDGSSSSVLSGSSSSEGNSSVVSSSSTDVKSSSSVVQGSSSSVALESSSSSKETCSDSLNWVYLNSGSEYGCIQDSRDNQYYKTVKIGSQVWMAENLNYDYNKGTAKSYCYSNSSANCDKYGRLYVWSAAMDSAAFFSDASEGCGFGKACAAASTSSTTVVRGVCPEGWHLPSNSDWSTLWGAIGGTSTAGTKLKSTSGWNGSGNGEDAYGFSVLPAGSTIAGFSNAGNRGFFWSSTEYNSNSAYFKGFYSNYPDVREGNGDASKLAAYSVRCLRDSN